MYTIIQEKQEPVFLLSLEHLANRVIINLCFALTSFCTI